MSGFILFPDRYYVGIGKSYALINPPLGFATPDGTDKAAIKRKETVDRWRDKEHDTLSFDNVPISGFEIKNSVSRWSTDNKLFRVVDPRGFQIEISTANLAELISDGAIINGVVQSKLVYGRYSNQNYLMYEYSKEYQDHINNVNKDVVIVPGDLIVDGRDRKPAIYMGKYYRIEYKYRYEHEIHRNRVSTYYGRSAYGPNCIRVELTKNKIELFKSDNYYYTRSSMKSVRLFEKTTEPFIQTKIIDPYPNDTYGKTLYYLDKNDRDRDVEEFNNKSDDELIDMIGRYAMKYHKFLDVESARESVKAHFAR